MAYMVSSPFINNCCYFRGLSEDAQHYIDRVQLEGQSQSLSRPPQSSRQSRPAPIRCSSDSLRPQFSSLPPRINSQFVLTSANPDQLRLTNTLLVGNSGIIAPLGSGTDIYFLPMNSLTHECLRGARKQRFHGCRWGSWPCRIGTIASTTTTLSH